MFAATSTELCTGDRVLVHPSRFRSSDLAAPARVRYVTYDGRARHGLVTVTSDPYQPREEWELPGDAVELVDRGNRWRYERDLPLLPFDTYADELSFWRSLGMAKQANNPAGRMYVWTVTEALFALSVGIVDVAVMSSGPLGLLSGPSLVAYRIIGDIPGGKRRLRDQCRRDLLSVI